MPPQQQNDENDRATGSTGSQQNQPNDPTLLTNIQRGGSVEIRLTTLLHGWLKGCQNAERESSAAFSQWIGTQTGLIDRYVEAVQGEQGSAQAMGTGQGTGQRR